MPRFLAPLLLASFALGATAPASAQDGPDEPLVLLMVSRTDAVDETAVIAVSCARGARKLLGCLLTTGRPQLQTVRLRSQELQGQWTPVTTTSSSISTTTTHCAALIRSLSLELSRSSKRSFQRC